MLNIKQILVTLEMLIINAILHQATLVVNLIATTDLNATRKMKSIERNLTIYQLHQEGQKRKFILMIVFILILEIQYMLVFFVLISVLCIIQEKQDSFAAFHRI